MPCCALPSKRIARKKKKGEEKKKKESGKKRRERKHGIKNKMNALSTMLVRGGATCFGISSSSSSMVVAGGTWVPTHTPSCYRVGITTPMWVPPPLLPYTSSSLLVPPRPPRPRHEEGALGWEKLARWLASVSMKKPPPSCWPAAAMVVGTTPPAGGDDTFDKSNNEEADEEEKGESGRKNHAWSLYAWSSKTCCCCCGCGCGCCCWRFFSSSSSSSSPP